jgi:hypothetical protein
MKALYFFIYNFSLFLGVQRSVEPAGLKAGFWLKGGGQYLDLDVDRTKLGSYCCA